MKKLTKWTCICLIICILLTFALCLASCSQSEVKNLIYIIGDGMGANHIKNAKLYMERDTLAFEKYYAGEVITHSADSDITDSAASATALATGTKTNNDYIGIDPDGNQLQNIMELSKKRGKKTAIVTTDNLNGATPASFSAHADSRSSTRDIVVSQAESKIDLFMGLYSSSYTVYKKDITKKNYNYVESMHELTAFSSKDKIVANIKNVDSAFNPELTDVVSLKTLVEYALDYLSSSKRGFTLMVEGAYIDKHSHSKDIMLMIYALMDLNEAVEYILDWASKRTDTAVIMTADHESGGLQLAYGKDNLSDDLYAEDYHTSVTVPLYLYNITTDATLLDNTDVYQLAKSIVKG